MSKHDTTRISLGGATLELLSGGSGRPLLFLHGEEGPRGWQAHHTALAASFQVHAPVMPGVGASTRPDWLESVPSLAKHYLWALDELKLGPVVLAGASLGGWVAAELATMAPERVSHLVLIGSQGIKTGHLNVPDLFTTPYRRYLKLASPTAEHLWTGEPTEADLDIDLETLEMSARLGFKPYMHDRLLLPALARYRNPALLLWGARDPITPAVIADQFKAALPRALLTLLPDTGHYVHLERPDAVATYIAAFAKG